MQTQVKLEVIPEFKKLSDTINKINKQVSGISKGIINHTQKQVFTQPSLIEQVKQRQMELRENHHTQKQIIDNKTIQIYTNAGAQEVQRVIENNSYTYADLED
ncbi:hypothetical protein LW135_00775 [Helicobacter sp. faydin-H20]|uniref:hypothetical protein n=1 Tax=Helicobacter anatolicus TaxID=2905874 RepID=UPI001E2B3D10|nr:hypothetical protein [Helicobacter anatolicus]MCE3036366.1 hypothetical protein [Helicobacter anatolicus]